MQHLDLHTLSLVTGGASKSTQITQSLSSIQSSISSLANTNNNSSSNLLLPVMMLALNKRQSPSVISAGGATVVQG